MTKRKTHSMREIGRFGLTLVGDAGGWECESGMAPSSTIVAGDMPLRQREEATPAWGRNWLRPGDKSSAGFSRPCGNLPPPHRRGKGMSFPSKGAPRCGRFVQPRSSRRMGAGRKSSFPSEPLIGGGTAGSPHLQIVLLRYLCLGLGTVVPS